ncbi:hypothetical protein MHC_01855 [Mycoplasma haemocanis str. Illinois]|uniref:Uncharacterized protein n=1 Tax=Mycoplasma haemocanis (strain Illinois) TaxID=1111676 RepID=H6N6G5_MYCHN|nr:hypothetical protein [Mycoplasma haemocanis]AEW45237.1 hypothetical protein MHC_01855 [Mycoplasma haemocanis str. Illinois]
MGFLGNKAILGLIGGVTTVGIGGSYFLLSDSNLLSRKKTGVFCAMLSPEVTQNKFMGCLYTFEKEEDFKDYLERQSKVESGKVASGLEDTLEKAKKAHQDGLVAFVYQRRDGAWTFPEDSQESLRQEYLKSKK